MLYAEAVLLTALPLKTTFRLSGGNSLLNMLLLLRLKRLETPVAMKNLKVNKLLPFAVLCLHTLFLTTEAATQGAYTDGQPAQLKALHIKKLKNLKVPIAVPTYIPAGYRLKEVLAKRYKEGNVLIVDYGISYENAQGDSFNINSTNEGIGDPLIITVLKGRNPFFQNLISVGPPDLTAQEPEGREREVGSDWIESKRTYVPTSALSRKQYYKLDGKGLSQKEGLKVMLSLRYLK